MVYISKMLDLVSDQSCISWQLMWQLNMHVHPHSSCCTAVLSVQKFHTDVLTQVVT